MKSFFAAFVGTLLGLAAFCCLAVVLVVGGLAVMSNFAEKGVVEVEEGAYLVLNLDGLNLTDAPPPVEQTGLGWLLGGEGPRALSLRGACAGLREAAVDTRIRGVFITGAFSPEGYGTGLAALRELRAALAEVKAAGKPVKAYFDELGTLELYLAAGAGELVLNPFGLVVMPGLASEPLFYAGAFEKWGVGVQVTRSGKYKGAVEPFTRTDLSPENRAQLSELLQGLWGGLRDEIAESRGMDPLQLQALVDAEGFIPPEAALAAGLVSKIGYRDEMLNELRQDTGVEAGEVFLQIALPAYLHTLQPVSRADGTIAVVYAEGEIVDGEGRDGEVGGAAFARELRALREDEEVAAVVLRVNSPGGSASAAEEMLRELRLLREAKPVVVSMGSFAASGGYWISTFGERIYAEPTTITGSIGVFGLQFNIEKLAGSIGLTWDRVTTGEKADLMTSARPKSPAEMAVFQRLVDRTYDEFLVRVAEGRGLAKAAVHEIAQGRVWTGARALEIGLVDEIGGLDAAIAHAAKLAEIEGAPAIEDYPSTRPLAEALAEIFEEGAYPETRFSARLRGPFGELARRAESQLRELAGFNDPCGVYARLPLDLRAR